MKKLAFIFILLLFFFSPKNFLFHNIALAETAPSNLNAVPSCEKDPTTGQFTVSTITFTWDSSFSNTKDYFQTNGMPNEVDAGTGGYSGTCPSCHPYILPNYSITANLPYNITYQWHVKSHYTGFCAPLVCTADATTEGPPVTTKDCTVQPTTTYDCDESNPASYTCVVHTGPGIGHYSTPDSCSTVCKTPRTNNYTCANRSPECSDLTQYPASKCTDFFDASGVPAAQWNCPASPDGCPMTNATVSPTTHSCALSKDYVCNSTGSEDDTCYTLGCAGPVQGTCKTGLFCDRTGASPLAPGTCKKVPTDFGTLCQSCATTDHWDGTGCADPDEKPTKATGGTYCNVSTKNETCVPGEGCVSTFGAGGIYGTSPFPPPSPACEQSGSQYICHTAIGNITTSTQGFVQAIMGLILSLVGGIAILLIIISGYRLMVSQGNPEGIKSAREQLTAAIIGLLFVIFALVFLEVIGVNILGLPGFGH